MTDIPESITRRKLVVTTPQVTLTLLIVEAEDVSTNNTITIDELTTISGAALFKQDGTTVSLTKATNVITVTQGSLTNVDLVGFAMGT